MPTDDPAEAAFLKRDGSCSSGIDPDETGSKNRHVSVAIGAMVVSAVPPLFCFRARGWL